MNILNELIKKAKAAQLKCVAKTTDKIEKLPSLWRRQNIFLGIYYLYLPRGVQNIFHKGDKVSKTQKLINVYI